jgi:hypothetical protein
MSVKAKLRRWHHDVTRESVVDIPESMGGTKRFQKQGSHYCVRWWCQLGSSQFQQWWSGSAHSWNVIRAPVCDFMLKQLSRYRRVICWSDHTENDWNNRNRETR